MKVAFIGHRNIEDVDVVKRKVKSVAESLIVGKNADVFLFGSKSDFDDLCHEAVSELKNKFVDIRRVYVRAEYENIDYEYIEYLLSMYEETFYPDSVKRAGVASYIKRNETMINLCDCLIVYYDEATALQRKASGTKRAVEYARRKGKRMINVFER